MKVHRRRIRLIKGLALAGCSLGLAAPIIADAYAANRSTGCFVLIDETTNDTVAAGVLQ